MVSIVGVGTAENMMTQKACETIKRAEVVIGASRIMDSYREYFNGKTVFSEVNIAKIKEIVRNFETKEIAVLVSGDTGFYSLANSLIREIPSCEVIPGISSVNSFFAKQKETWQDAALISVHGRNKNLVDTVRRNRKTFVLTGGNIEEVAQSLAKAGFGDLEVYVGSNLDTPEEVMEHTTVSGLLGKSYEILSVLFIINEKWNASCPCGIPDEEFERGEVPMTKAEVRAAIIGKLRITPRDTCYDIGAGTGSVTVEMALSAYEGKVIAIEKRKEGVELIHQNLRKFHIGNAEVIQGEALQVLEREDLPPADVVFVGGSNGTLKEIIASLYKKNPKARMVVSAVALETLQVATETFKTLNIETEIVQISVAKSREISGLHMMMANNPVYLIRGL